MNGDDDFAPTGGRDDETIDLDTRAGVPRARGFAKLNLAASALKAHTMRPVKLPHPPNLLRGLSKRTIRTPRIRQRKV